MMFFLVGVIYERAHHREISRFGGLASTMPQYWGFSTVGFFANLGLPGLCGFIGEVMVLIGSFAAARASYDVNGNVLEENSSILMYATNGAAYWPIMTLAIIACFGVILTAGYMLQTMQRVFFGPEKAEYQGFAEVDGREIAVLTPLTIMAILLGILPTLFFFAFTDSTVKALFGVFNKAAAVAGGF
jgi:NADH-quinone oxidoreductase subunit M